jgi:hypothetical protein
MADFSGRAGTYRSGKPGLCAGRATGCRERPTEKGAGRRIPLARNELGVSHAGDAQKSYFPLLPVEAGAEPARLPLPAEAEPDFAALLPTEADGDLPAGMLATSP